MQKYNVKKIVFSSSACVYGDPEVLPLHENCKLSATNPYGKSKLAIETILQDLYISDNSWQVVLLRYFNPIGSHESALIGENPNGIPNNLAPYIVKVAKGELPYLRVFGNDYNTPDGTGVRDYIHVVDLAKGHTVVLNKLQDNGVYIYNLGTGRGYSVLEVLNAFERATQKEIPFLISPRRSGDVATLVADPKKANIELNWFAEKTLDEMATSLWNYSKK